MNDLYNHAMNFDVSGKRMTDKEIIAKSKELGFQGVELLHSFDAEIAFLLEEYDMKATHVMQNLTFPGFMENIPVMQKAGIRYINMSPNFYDHDTAMKCAELLNKEGKKAKEYGFKVYYHNHTNEFWFDEVDRQYLWETVVKNTNPEYVCFQLDVGFSNMTGADAVYLLKKYPGRIELMHIRPCTKIIGSGKVFRTTLLNEAGRPGSPDFGKKEELPPPVEMIEQIKLTESAEGRMSENIHNLDSIMNIAKESGCQVFILVRNAFYHEDRVQVIQEDVQYIRKFW